MSPPSLLISSCPCPHPPAHLKTKCPLITEPPEYEQSDGGRDDKQATNLGKTMDNDVDDDVDNEDDDADDVGYDIDKDNYNY